MASTSFRDSINSMGWSRRDVDVPVNTSAQNPILSRLQLLNPFGNSGYVSLPTQEPGAPLPAPSRREEEEGFFAREYYDQYTLHVLSRNIYPRLAGDKTRVPAQAVFVTRKQKIMHLPFPVCDQAYTA